MPYLTEPEAIKSLIDKLALSNILWLDTEIADWSTKNPRLSLIQVSDDPKDLTGDSTFVLDVLDKHDLAAYFINQIMVNQQIEKIFHNAGFDLKYLGNKQAQNVTCTLKLANKISLDKLGTANRKLKTLAAGLCNFSNVDAEEQASDWARRPLTTKQLQYAKMDVVYLAQVHRRLLELTNQNHKYFTPTKVRIAFECGRLFYLNQHFGGKTLFIPDENFIGIGKEFHQLAENLANLLKNEPRFKDLFAPAATQLILEETAAQMQQLFYELAFFPHLQTAIQANPDKVTALYQVWQALIPLIRRWAELLIKNRRYCNATEVISKTFVESELKVDHGFTLPNGSKQVVRGQFDSLIYDCEHQRLCVVEYKTYQPVDVSAQLAQVALYSYMLWVKKQVPVDSAVYCVAPEFKEYQFSWEDLENTVHKLIPHKLQQMQEWLTWKPPQNNPPPATTQSHLCQICPQQEKCQSFFVVGTPPPTPPRPQGGEQSSIAINPDIVAEETPPPTPPRTQGGEQEQGETTINPDVVAEELVNILQSFGIGVDYQGAVVAPAFIRVKLKPQLGVKVVSILNRSADLQVQLGLANPPLIAPQAGFVSVDLPRLDRQVATFEDYIQRQNLPATAPVKIAMGVNLDGELIEADLSDPNTCHFLVGGTTGSGKSEFLRSLLLSLLVRHSPKHLKIALVDPKRVTFPEFEQSSWLYSPVVKESDRAISLMDDLVAEMGRRYQRFETAKCADINSYNQKADQPLPRIVCIFDEYADFMAEKPTREALELSIKRLGAMARAAGIHLIIATQRPEAKVVTPLIRSNLPGRVALRTASEADSTIILGGKQTEAAYLLGKGDLLYQAGANLLRLQSLLANNVTVRE
ncbi:MAG: DNA translocase FtsK [Crinalium sp.]